MKAQDWRHNRIIGQPPPPRLSDAHIFLYLLKELHWPQGWGCAGVKTFVCLPVIKGYELHKQQKDLCISSFHIFLCFTDRYVSASSTDGIRKHVFVCACLWPAGHQLRLLSPWRGAASCRQKATLPVLRMQLQTSALDTFYCTSCKSLCKHWFLHLCNGFGFFCLQGYLHALNCHCRLLKKKGNLSLLCCRDIIQEAVSIPKKLCALYESFSHLD